MILPFPSLLLGFKCWKQHTCKLKLLSSPIPTLNSNVKLLSAKLFKRRNKVLVLGQYKKKRCPWNQWFRTFYTKSQPFNTSHYEKDFLFYFTFKWSCAVQMYRAHACYSISSTSTLALTSLDGILGRPDLVPLFPSDPSVRVGDYFLNFVINVHNIRIRFEYMSKLENFNDYITLLGLLIDTHRITKWKHSFGNFPDLMLGT